MTTFKEIDLSPEILAAVEDLGFTTATPVQEQVIPFLKNNNQDLIALAQTGTGKTAAFGLPIIEKLIQIKKPQVIILSPTRELCIQITKDLKSYCKYRKDVKIAAIYGGARIDTQIKKLQDGVQIIVATPGRMNDIIRRNKVTLSKIKTVILDEADEMLDMGFQEELDAILDKTPKQKNTLLFSATMSKQVEKIAQKYINDAFTITVGKRNTGAENIEHVFYMVHAKDRYLMLKRIADINPDIYGIIFCRTRQDTKDIAEQLIADGYNADALHGDLSQTQREYIMNKFRSKNIQMLVATDVAARGLDVDDLTHIINYRLPEDIEIYTHRSGRTGRAGKYGVSVVIINMKEKGKIHRIERMIGKNFKQLPIPTGIEICEKQFYHLIDKVKQVNVNEAQIAPFMEKVYEKLESFSREDIIKHFVSLEFNLLLKYYQNEKDLSLYEKNEKQKPEYVALHINIGRQNGISPVDIIGLVNKASKGIHIGDIRIMETFSFFEVSRFEEEKIVKALSRMKHRGKRLKVELSKKPLRRKERDSKGKGNKRKGKGRRKF